MGAPSGTVHPGPHASPGCRSRILGAEVGQGTQHQVRAGAQVESVCAPYSDQNGGKAPARVCPQGRKLGCILCSTPHQHSGSHQVLLSLVPSHLLKQSLFSLPLIATITRVATSHGLPGSLLCLCFPSLPPSPTHQPAGFSPAEASTVPLLGLLQLPTLWHIPALPSGPIPLHTLPDS